ncbi:uncharacterized protein LOC130444573 isoform X2 [Diorhabda sublineata]|nr:uncharacterized protein LOC130444573 isoform X2 [Diorhabda sublineata]
MKILTVLLLLFCHVWCKPPMCEQIHIDNNELTGQCCLFIKGGVYDKQRSIQDFVNSLDSFSTKTKNVEKIIYPDDDVSQWKPNKNNRNMKIIPPVDSAITQKPMHSDENNNKNVSLARRVNVDVPVTCTQGKRKDADGECVTEFQ